MRHFWFGTASNKKDADCLWVGKELFHGLRESGQLGFQDAPDQPIIDVGVALNQKVAKRHDAPVFGDLFRQPRIGLGDLAQGLARDSELPLHAGSRQLDVPVVRKIGLSHEMVDMRAAAARMSNEYFLGSRSIQKGLGLFDFAPQVRVGYR